MNRIESLERMLASGQDSALLRYSLGLACQADGRLDGAREHLAQAVAQNPDYSAAWKAYGKVLVEAGHHEDAAAAFERGIAVAERKGDIQAAKEMKVFLKRIKKLFSA